MKSVTRWDMSRMPAVQLAIALTPPVIWNALYRWLVVKDIKGAEYYRPRYSPWLEDGFTAEYARIKNLTWCSVDRCWVLSTLLRQALNIDGDVMEAGVFQGGTALLLKRITEERPAKALRLFDSFEGMKDADPHHDRHRIGDFSGTSLDAVQKAVGNDAFIDYRKGWIPATFLGLSDNEFCFAHIDVDLYQSIMDCCLFLYPRMPRGGIIVFDDYGFASCPGARQAVDEFFSDKPENPLTLHTGQAVIFKL
jgi:O-methyltransferase